MTSKLVETAQSASKTAQAAQAEVGAQVGKLIKKVQTRVQEVQGSLQATVQNKVPQITDQMLLNLSQSGSQILQQTLQRIEQNPHDLVGRVGRAVWERAAAVRAQMLESEAVPDPVKRTLEDWGPKASTAPMDSVSVDEVAEAATVQPESEMHAESKVPAPPTRTAKAKSARATKATSASKKSAPRARRKSTPTP